MRNSLGSVCIGFSQKLPMKRISSPSHCTAATNERLPFVCAVCCKLINVHRIGLPSWFSGSAAKFNTSLKRHDCQSWVIWPGVAARVERNGPLHYIMVLENICRWPMILTLSLSEPLVVLTLYSVLSLTAKNAMSWHLESQVVLQCGLCDLYGPSFPG